MVTLTMLNGIKGNFMSSTTSINTQAFNPATAGSPKQSLISVARKVGKALKTKNPSQQFNKDGSNIGFAWVPADKLFINYGRQRFPEPKHIHKLMSKWNLHCVTPLTARYSRTEDRYYISDGQQHSIGWLLTYGEDTELPVFFVESEDENIESVQLLALNCDNQSMAPYFIHRQQIIMGDQEAIALDNAVTAAGCEIAYKKRSAGTITHMPHLYKARDNFTLSDITEILTLMRQTWPTKPIQPDVMRGLLYVKSLMKATGTYTDALFDDIIHEASVRYADERGLDCPEALKNAVQAQCMVDLETTAIGAEVKLSSGILSIYEQVKNVDVTNGNRPFTALNMPVIV
jgi:hypothetical protein